MLWVKFHSCAVVLSNVPRDAQSCSDIVQIDLKLLKILKPEHCLSVFIVGNALDLSFIIIPDTYGIGIDVT